jgi:hypothetical protein
VTGVEVTERYFQLQSEWNVIHLPDKPTGFGVLVIGDKSQFVEESASFWSQHYGRMQILSALRSEGYTLFNSNLFGRHWGSEKAVSFAKKLIHVVLKKEILNEKIHVLAEGMGALVALELMERIPEKIRSVAMLNPCLDLNTHIKTEKDHKFFYKRIRKEIIDAYQLDDKQVLPRFPNMTQYNNTLPVRIWERMQGGVYQYQFHSKKYEEHRKNLKEPIVLSFYLAEQPFRLQQSIVKFFKENEKLL